MKKQLSIVVISFAILASGCAQKKVSDLKVKNGVVPRKHHHMLGRSHINRSPNGYKNVDLYGHRHNNGHVNSHMNGNINSNNGDIDRNKYRNNYGNNYRNSSRNSSGNSYGDNSYGDASGAIKNVYFDVNQYIITPDKLPTIINDAKILSGVVKSGSRVKVEGHCDATGTDEYNYALGLRRAKSAKEALVEHGIDASNIMIVSMGESSPACTIDNSSACYAKNRRVEFKVIR
ncbi:MAG: OmpA family protein [Sulfurovaceae bacterium]|nr:OmpA family protein [Sulfurovaceae bacterium]